MPTLGELASKGQLHRVARYLRQELSPLDFERAPEAFEERLEMLLAEALATVATTEGQQKHKKTDKSQTSSTKSQTNSNRQIPKEQGIAAAYHSQPPTSGKTKFFRYVAESLASSHHPERNEDRWVTLPEANLAAVLDGVGGSAAAAAASSWVAEALRKEVDDMIKSGETVTDWPAALKQLGQTLNQQFLAAANKDNRLAGGSTTLAIATIIEDQDQKKLAYGVVGDSRVSIWYKRDNRYELSALDDQLLRLLLAPFEKRPKWLAPLLTKHSLPVDITLDANQAAKLATILDQDPDPGQHDEIAKFLFAERAIVTQVLGAPNVNPHTGLLPVAAGDRILLATDGIHDNLTERELVTILSSTELAEVASALVVRANEVAKSGAPRAKMDDMTAVVLEII